MSFYTRILRQYRVYLWFRSNTCVFFFFFAKFKYMDGCIIFVETGSAPPTITYYEKKFSIVKVPKVGKAKFYTRKFRVIYKYILFYVNCVRLRVYGDLCGFFSPKLKEISKTNITKYELCSGT